MIIICVTQATRANFLGTRYRNVVYGLAPKSIGLSVVLPHGIIPWTEDFNQVVTHNLGSGTGLDQKDFLNIYNQSMMQ